MLIWLPLSSVSWWISLLPRVRGRSHHHVVDDSHHCCAPFWRACPSSYPGRFFFHVFPWLLVPALPWHRTPAGPPFWGETSPSPHFVWLGWHSVSRSGRAKTGPGGLLKERVPSLAVPSNWLWLPLWSPLTEPHSLQHSTPRRNARRREAAHSFISRPAGWPCGPSGLLEPPSNGHWVMRNPTKTQSVPTCLQPKENNFNAAQKIRQLKSFPLPPEQGKTRNHSTTIQHESQQFGKLLSCRPLQFFIAQRCGRRCCSAGWNAHLRPTCHQVVSARSDLRPTQGPVWGAPLPGPGVEGHHLAPASGKASRLPDSTCL